MASNSFGQLFRITTWGESHGPAMGVVIDGCPAGLKIEANDIDAALSFRAGGKNNYTTARKEPDSASILSGLFEGVTTGAPISILIPNRDVDSSAYEPIKDLLRPGHANYTFLEKYGLFDYRGGGRASARETVCRVAAGAVATKLLRGIGVKIVAYVKAIGEVAACIATENAEELKKERDTHPLFCPDHLAGSAMEAVVTEAKEQGDSVGGIVEFIVNGLPSGLGDPVYNKLEASLGAAMMGLPAAKGFEMGEGFRAAAMRGSEHNDRFVREEGTVKTATNHAGGTLGGISTGMPLVGRVAFKPASSIKKPQETVTHSGEETTLEFPSHSRHDPCVAIRAVPVVEAMVALVLVDAFLLNQCVRINQITPAHSLCGDAPLQETAPHSPHPSVSL